MMREPPAAPVTSSIAPSFSTNVGLIEESGRFSGAGRVGVVAHQAEGVGGAGLGGEIVEFVVEQHAGALGDEAAAVGQVQRIGVGDGVAVGVDDDEMRRLVALVALRLAGRDLCRRPRADRPRSSRADASA